MATNPTSPSPKKMENLQTQPINQDVMDLLKNKGNPKSTPEIKKAKQQLLQTIKQYNINPQQLIEGGKLSSTALKDPKMYPIAVQYAVRQGLITPQDVAPEGIDYKLLATGITVGKITQEPISEGKL